MTNKLITNRQRVDGYWVAIFYEELQKGMWHVGINICKSKRAQADWYKKRKNRRARRASSVPTGRNQRGLAALYRMFRASHLKFPPGTAFISIPTSPKRAAISKYIERLGFKCYPQDGLLVWVLITPQNLGV
jgi:hypothetical protein